MFGLDYHRRKLNDAAENIAHVGVRPEPGEGQAVDLAREMVEMIVAKHGFSANAKTIQVADEMLGSLIDVLA
jgi:flagellar basal body rod protein FlgG